VGVPVIPVVVIEVLPVFSGLPSVVLPVFPGIVPAFAQIITTLVETI
jgi:hypothetical protein